MFNSVKSNKVSQSIIDQIREAIFDGRLNPGDKLPSEKELGEKFKVSKATLREALRSLEVLGFLEIRKGVSGGAFVTEVDLTKAKYCFTNFLLFKNLSLKDLSEVRLLLEPYIAEKASCIIGEEELRRLETLIENSKEAIRNNVPFESRKDEVEFHRILASSAGNPILMFLLDFVENLLVDTKNILKPGKAFSQKVLISHQRIYEGILEGNCKKVRKEMENHILEVEKDLLTAHRERRIRGQKGVEKDKRGGSVPVFARHV
jgi:GntR family transcriptional repressor for pyruvate dehydrogenase complex